MTGEPRFRALATDYDGTLARDGIASPTTLDALARVRASGRLLYLVTGRAEADLDRVLPGHRSLFDAAVVENGARLLLPPPRHDRELAPPASQRLLRELHDRGIPFTAGLSLVSVRVERRSQVEAVLTSLGLEVALIRNKDSLMILPPGIDKGSGLEVLLEADRIPAAAVVACGDAENDLPMLRRAGLGVAVANALPEVGRVAGLVTAAGWGEGVVEVIDALLRGELDHPVAAASAS